MTGPYRHATHVSFDESDPAGVLFYGSVFPLAHRAFERMIVAAGIPWEDWFDAPRFAVPVTHAEVDFSGPLPAGAAVDIDVSVAEIRTSACAIDAIFSIDDRPRARVRTVHVFIDRETREKRAIPPRLRDALARRQSDASS